MFGALFARSALTTTSTGSLNRSTTARTHRIRAVTSRCSNVAPPNTRGFGSHTSDALRSPSLGCRISETALPTWPRMTSRRTTGFLARAVALAIAASGLLLSACGTHTTTSSISGRSARASPTRPSVARHPARRRRHESKSGHRPRPATARSRKLFRPELLRAARMFHRQVYLPAIDHLGVRETANILRAAIPLGRRSRSRQADRAAKRPLGRPRGRGVGGTCAGSEESSFPRIAQAGRPFDQQRDGGVVGAKPLTRDTGAGLGNAAVGRIRSPRPR
jgi:hypothetical protein